MPGTFSVVEAAVFASVSAGRLTAGVVTEDGGEVTGVLPGAVPEAVAVLA